MSFGKMNTFVELFRTEIVKDTEGFTSEQEMTLARIRAYREERHDTEKWANRAAFSSATALFRFRGIPGVTVDASLFLICEGVRYRITSAEDVRSRGMYVEVLAERIEATVR